MTQVAFFRQISFALLIGGSVIIGLTRCGPSPSEGVTSVTLAGAPELLPTAGAPELRLVAQPSSIYQMQADDTGLCLEVHNASLAAGMHTVYARCDAARRTQQLEMVRSTEGFYQIIFLHSGLCLTATGEGEKKAIQEPCRADKQAIQIKYSCQVGSRNLGSKARAFFNEFQPGRVHF